MKEFEVFTCCLPLGDESLLLGSSYGKVYMGRLKTLREIEALDFTNDDYFNVLEEISPEIFNLGGTIRAIERLDSENTIILSSYGDIICFNINDNSSTQVQEGNSSKYNNTWRLLVIDENRFLTIGNYKKLKLWLKVDENFESYTEPEYQEFNETHAYFCMDWVERDKTFIINNFKRYTELWEVTDSGISRISSFQLEGNLQKCLIVENSYLITVDYYGYIYVFRREDDVFNKVFEFRISSNQGNTVFFSSETDLILIGTITELIFLKKDFQNIYIKNITVKQLFSFNDFELILTDKEIVRLNYDSKETPPSIINYRYKKVGLVGDHDVGKTTFCRYLKYGPLTEEQLVSEESSLGRHVWTIKVEDEEDDWFISENIKKILYFDIAGQKSEHFTYFPMLYDSDIILLFYQGTDRDTFDQVVEYYLELRERCTNAKFYFIQTHSEQHQRPRDRYLERELNKIGLDININLIKIDSKTGIGYDDFDGKVLQNLDWESAPTVFEMPVFGTLMEYFDQIYNTGRSTSVSLNELSQLVLNLDEIRLENIILSFYQRGIIQYLEEEKTILINYEEYEIMHSEIANLIDEEYGYVKTHLIYQELGDDTSKISYIKNILKYFRDNEIGIVFKKNVPNKETYIFLRKLKDNLEVPSTYETNIPKNLTNFGFSNIILQLEIFLVFLNSYPLELISISKSEILVKMDHDPDNALLFVKINSVSEDETVKLCSFGINKTEDIDYKLEKDLTSFILNNLGENLKDISMESDYSLHDLSIQEQIKFLLKNPSERPYIDFKRKYRLDDSSEKAEFLKDTIGLTNSAIFCDNLAFLFVGIEEKNGKILKLHNINNASMLETQSAPLLDIYLNNYPRMEFQEIKINELYEWQQNGEISSEIPFTADQKENENEDKILVIKYIRQEQKVCDIKAVMNFEKNRKPKIYNRGYCWWRINSYSFFISEIEKEILRTK